MQQEMEAKRQDLLAKERSLDQAETAAERRWAKLSEDVSAKVCGALAHHGHGMVSFRILHIHTPQLAKRLSLVYCCCSSFIDQGWRKYHTSHQHREPQWSSVFWLGCAQGCRGSLQGLCCLTGRDGDAGVKG